MTTTTTVRRQATRDALTLLELSRRPTGSLLPVNTATAAEKVGITVGAAALDPDVAVRLVKRRGHDARITVNSADGSHRQQVACAHAIGHFYGRRAELDEYEYEDRRANLASGVDDEDEAYANEFAASLLMPELFVRDMVRRGYDEVRMAWSFFVPRDVMHHRLQSLGLR